MKAAIIGSFRHHYSFVRSALTVLIECGVEVTSPKGTDILQPGIEFVRFESDSKDWDDPTVQTIALHRILRADAVYVVAPDGYVGRTTCYEIGRVVQANHPLYFSEFPRDLPITVPANHVLDPSEFALTLKARSTVPMFSRPDLYSTLERRLLSGDYSEA